MKEENDLIASEHLTFVHAHFDELNRLHRDGKLDAAWLLAYRMNTSLDKYLRRLNDIKFQKEKPK